MPVARMPVARRPVARTGFAPPAAAALLVACTGAPPTEEDVDRQRILADLSAEVALPAWAGLDAAVGTFRARSEAYCAGDATLAEVQAAWGDARTAWQRTAPWDLEPTVTLRTAANLDFWPIRAEDPAALLASGDPIDLATAGATVRGLPIAEWLLWGAPAPADDPRRCEYLVALARDAEATAHAAHLAWSPEGGDYATELATAGEGSEALPTQALAFSDLVNQVLEVLEADKAKRLGVPLGDKAGGTPQPSQVESPASGRSVQELRDNVAGIEAVWRGGGGHGLATLVAHDRPDTADAMDRQLAAVGEALDAIDGPLAAAVVDDREDVVAAQDAVREVLMTVQLEVALVYGVTLTFNDNDGD